MVKHLNCDVKFLASEKGMPELCKTKHQQIYEKKDSNVILRSQPCFTVRIVI